jgi:hypothetical protein
MFAMLETAHRAGYDRARLIFETPRQVLRPVMGKVVLRELTAAHVSIGAGGDAAAGEFVRPGDAATCGQLAARVVALRRAGLSVVLAPGASAP